MLSFKFVTSASGAAHYFEASDDYYGNEGHRGDWLGHGVIDLGLDGTHAVDRETFQNLLDGQLPNGKRIRLSPGMNLTAEIKTGQRRVIEYLLSPIQRATAESLRER